MQEDNGGSIFYNNKPKQQEKEKRGEDQQSKKQKTKSEYSIQNEKERDKRQKVQDPTFAHKEIVQETLKKSILLSNSQDEKQSWLTKCCSCANLENYKKFFHVTNADVVKRIKSNLQFWEPGFFKENQQYDFYGPFWILTTVIFCLSAVPNILNYQGSQNFQYNFEAVGLAFGFIYVEGFLFPVALTFVLKYFGVQCTHIQNVCLYGYSMCTSIICLLLCSFNVCILHIVLLAYAFGTKAWFIFNNISKSYQIPTAKKAIVTGLIIGQACLQFFVIKMFFIKCIDEPAASTTQNHQMSSHFYEQRHFDS